MSEVVKRRPPTPLSRDEVKRILRRARKPRDKALIVLLWRGGLRISEACSLEVRDCESTSSRGLRIHVRNGKGGRARFQTLDKRAADYIRPMLRGKSARAPVLATRTGKRVHMSYCQHALRLIGRDALVQKRVHPHAFRHAFARELHDEGWSMREIQLALGHARISTTAVYLQSIGALEVQDKLAMRPEW